MARILKKIDYLELVLLIYKTSDLDKYKLLILFKYTGLKLIETGFNPLYIDKLVLDLNLLEETKEEGKSYVMVNENKLIKELETNFSYYELINFKSIIHDILRSGYYE